MRRRALVLLGLLALSQPAAAGAQEAAPDFIAKPQWVGRPSGPDVAGKFPAGAIRAKLNGETQLSCRALADGRLERCQTILELPSGQGFAAAAMVLAPKFRMKPVDGVGRPVAGRLVIVPMIWRINGGKEPLVAVTKPLWSRTPTPAELAAAGPRGPKALGAAVVPVVCRVALGGELNNCQASKEDPTSAAFQAAVSALAPTFQLEFAPGFRPPSRLVVELQIAFPEVAAAAQPATISQANWRSLPTPADVQAAFPVKARETKVASGRAVLDCGLDHQGYLVGCKPIEETPGGLGFGEAAVGLAAKMRADPWTAPGLPTDGARIRIPLRMADEAAAPSQAASPN